MKYSKALEIAKESFWKYFENEEDVEFYAEKALQAAADIGMHPPVQYGAHVDPDLQYADEVTKEYCKWDDE